MVKTVIFDLGGVIVPFDFRRGYSKMAPLCRYPAEQIPIRIRSTDLVPRFESGLIQPREFVKELTQILDLQASYEEFCDLWTSIFLPHTLIPEWFLEKVRARYRLLLLSNTNAIHFEMIQLKYPLLRHFDDFVLSYKVGAMKPSAQIYDAAVAKAQCRPEECFFTDDVMAYVEGAQAKGIQAVQFQGFEALQSAMADLF